MAVRRKPVASVDEFIHAGGAESVAAEKAASQAKVLPAIQPVKMRLDADLLAQIDAAVNARRPAPSRHQWILEAIYEKLDREQSA